jgi:outer membrane protein TolC
MAALNIGVAQQEKVQVAARSLPRVDLEGSWTDYTREYDEEIRFPEEQRDYYSVSLRVSFQPFQGGKNIFAWRRQGLTVEKMRQLQLDTAKGVDTEIRSAFSQWQESDSRLAASADTLRQAAEAWSFADRALELGVGSLRGLLDAELRRTRAEITRLALCSSGNMPGRILPTPSASYRNQATEGKGISGGGRIRPSLLISRA